jgi:hypothetical protein
MRKRHAVEKGNELPENENSILGDMSNFASVSDSMYCRPDYKREESDQDLNPSDLKHRRIRRPSFRGKVSTHCH